MSRLTSPTRLCALAGLLAITLLLAGTGRASDDSRVRLLVKFNTTPSREQVTALAATGLQRDDGIPELGVDVLSVPEDEAATAIAQLRSLGVDYVERDEVAQTAELLPSDPSFPQTFAIWNGAWGWYKTRTTQAWDITRGSPSVVIAVLDTGLKPQGLSDLSGQVVSGWNVLTHTSDTASSAGNHGTQVAGVVGLGLDNGVGNAGFCPGCRIMPVQVGSDQGANLSDIAAGITWATDHGAKVISMSWEAPSSTTTLNNAVSYARSHGAVVIAAAGNDSCNCVRYPAGISGVIGVAGTLEDDTRASYSNYGTWVKVAAPSSLISSWAGVGYARVVGTSFAAPAAAGIAGLLFSAAPNATGSQVEQALQTSAIHVGFALQYGRVDALAALQALGFSDPQSSSSPVNTSAPQIRLETNDDFDSATLSTAPQPGQVLLRGQGAWTGSAPLSLSSVVWKRCDGSGANCVVVGTDAKYTVQAADLGSTLRLAVTVSNSLGAVTREAPLSLPVYDPSAPPSAPANTTPPSVSGSTVSTQTVSTSQGAWTGGPTSYAYQWQRCDSSGANCANIGGASSSTYTLVNADIGKRVRSVVTASNSVGSSSATSPASNVVTPFNPTAVTFRGLAARRTTHGVSVTWRTASEVAAAGYNLYRVSPSGRVKLNRSLIRAGFGLLGSTYRWVDRAHARGTYWVQVVERNGARVWHGPASAR